MDELQVTVARDAAPVIATCAECGEILMRSWEVPQDTAYMLDPAYVAIGCQSCGYFGTMRWWQQLYSPQTEPASSS